MKNEIDMKKYIILIISLFIAAINFNLFLKNMPFDAVSIAPTREEIGNVYRTITQTGILADKIIYSFINTLGYGKTMVSLIVLEDLGLIYKDNDKYFKNANAQKTNLANSTIYNKIK